jgi:hypothetical protein
MYVVSFLYFKVCQRSTLAHSAITERYLIALITSHSRSDSLPVDPVVLTVHITHITHSYH